MYIANEWLKTLMGACNHFATAEEHSSGPYVLFIGKYGLPMSPYHQKHNHCAHKENNHLPMTHLLIRRKENS
jgi:hypothetical protein